MHALGFLVVGWGMKTTSKDRRRASRRTTAAEREQILREYRASGLSRRAFAERRGINLLTFHSWFRKREPKPRTGKASTPFVRVAVQAEAEAEVRLIAEYPSGLRIRLEGVDIRRAARLLREVSAC
jgi:transposase-like protein